MTKTQVHAFQVLCKSIADAIKESTDPDDPISGMPSGILFANLSQFNISLDSYHKIIAAMKRVKYVEEKNYLLRWIGPR